ncbi:hypothetical protein OSTOST_12849, partial [Ostertagia ostertagi]
MLMYTKQNTIKVYNARKYRILQEYPLKINEYFGPGFSTIFELDSSVSFLLDFLKHPQ